MTNGANYLKKHKGSNDWTPIIGDKLSKFRIEKLENEYKIDNAQAIKISNSANLILSKCANPNNPNEKVTGLVFGDVQSGKTLSFTSLAINASENGYGVVIILVGTKLNLAKQNKKRLIEDLSIDKNRSWKNYHNPTSDHLKEIQSDIDDTEATLLLTVLKSANRINKVSDTISRIKNINSIFIIDDEADQASMNTQASKGGDPSTTYKAILKLIDQDFTISYVQYTATPQAPIFITLGDTLSPKFVHVLDSSPDYTGLKTFFIDGLDKYVKPIHHLRAKKPWDGVILPKEFKDKKTPKSPPISLKYALQYFFLGVANSWMENDGKQPLETDKVVSMLIHPHQSQNSHKIFYEYVNQIIDNWLLLIKKGDPGINNEFELSYKELHKNKKLFTLDELMGILGQVINQTRRQIVNSKKGNSSIVKWKKAYSWIIIGGAAADRGFTVEGLRVTYMPRNARKGNADTIQQRCRFFGFKKSYLDYCAIYLPYQSRDIYQAYFRHENSLKKMITKFYEKNPNSNFKDCRRQVLLNENMQLVRNNILSYQDEFKRLNLSKMFSLNKISPKNIKDVHHNITLVDKLFKSVKQDLTLFSQNGNTDLRKHAYIDLEHNKSQNFRDLLIDWKVNDTNDSLRYQHLVNHILDTSIKVFVVFMEVGGNMGQSFIAERSFINTKEEYELATGRSGPGGTYKGHNFYKSDIIQGMEDLLTVQVYRFKHRNKDQYYGHKNVALHFHLKKKNILEDDIILKN